MGKASTSFKSLKNRSTTQLEHYTMSYKLCTAQENWHSKHYEQKPAGPVRCLEKKRKKD
jgi:hypothetical protein